MSEPAGANGARLTHLDADGRARMVDVSEKAPTRRRAVAGGRLVMAAETLALLRSGGGPKGDALGVARIAGVMGAKRTADLIPLCHPLPIDEIGLDFRLLDAAEGGPAVEIEAWVVVTARTGVEMEAMTAVAVAGLALYDMLKAADRGMRLEAVRLLRKEGGRSGLWEAP